MKIVVPENLNIISNKHLNEISKLGDVTIYRDFPATDEEIISRIKDAEIIVTKMTRLKENILIHCPKLKYIIIVSVGINFIDNKKATELGIKIINCPIHNTNAVAEHTLALLFALARNIVASQNALRNGLWRKTPYEFMGTELSGKTMGLIGYGNIGQAVAKLAKGIGMNVIYVDAINTPSDIDNLIKTADVVSIHVTYNKSTHHLLNENRLRLMKPTAYLINTSRGGIIDTKPLYQLLKSRQIAGAGLDVFENEPYKTKPSPEIVNLARLPNVIATPHIGFNTKEAGIRAGEEIIKNIKACISGKPINVKN